MGLHGSRYRDSGVRDGPAAVRVGQGWGYRHDGGPRRHPGAQRGLLAQYFCGRFLVRVLEQQLGGERVDLWRDSVVHHKWCYDP